MQHQSRDWQFELHEDGVVGRANLAPSGYVWSVEVGLPYRGRGLGRRLMLLMIQAARDRGHCFVRVRVHWDNAVALGLYGSLGFTRIGHGVDRDGEWSEMELEIDDV